MEKSTIEKYLKTCEFGRNLVCLDKTESTNLDVKKAASNGCPHGYTVVAEEQTVGRGRLDHAWMSPSGINIYVSILLKPRTAPSSFPQIPVICAIALHQTLAKMAPSLALSLKWPNDLLTTDSHRKISGILCEGVTMKDRSMAVVAGIGINVNSSLEDFSEDLRTTASSLKMATGRSWSREEVLAEFLNSFERTFNEWEAAGGTLRPFMDYWNSHDLLAGRDIAILQDGKTEEGVSRGIDDEGRLLLETPDGVRLVHAGDVHLRW
jgi:BirA family biotin operon repressor/biotin-[acetyl-CoA-carboxylase] ligase